MIATLAIQCKAATGPSGTFLYLGPSDCRVPVSPVFNRSGELFAWCEANNWTLMKYGPMTYANPDYAFTVAVDGTEPVSLEKFVKDYTAAGACPSAGEWAAVVSLQVGSSTFVGKLDVKRIS